MSEPETGRSRTEDPPDTGSAPTDAEGAPGAESTTDETGAPEQKVSPAGPRTAAAAGAEKQGARRPRVSARTLGRVANAVRTQVAEGVWLVAVLCAAVLAIGAVLVLLGANAANPVVTWFSDTADRLAGPLDTVFTFRKDGGAPDEVKNTVVNWGIAALAYLGVGRLAQRLLRPSV